MKQASGACSAGVAATWCLLISSYSFLSQRLATRLVLFDTMHLAVAETFLECLSSTGWLTSLSMVSSRFIYVISYCRISFSFRAEKDFSVWAYHSFFIRSFTKGHCCFSTSWLLWLALQYTWKCWPLQDLNFHSLNFFIGFIHFIFLCRYFAFMYKCVPRMWLVATEVGRGHQIP